MAEEHPLVYVILVNWNGKADTLECLSSLQKVHYSNARVLVVDNASSDGSVEAFRSQFPSVELIENSVNVRFAGGNNVGIRHALERGAEYVLVLNNDTVVDAMVLDELIRTAESDPSIGMVGAKVLYYTDPQRIWFAGGRIHWWSGWIAHEGIREMDRRQHDIVKDVDYLTGCCILAKREVIEEIGLFDERFFMYGEDVDWCLRARRAGYRLVFQPKAKVWHKVSVSVGGHFSWFKNWNKLKSNLRLLWRYAKPYHWLTIPVGMLGRIAWGWFRAVKSHYNLGMKTR
ncbi:MAG TPA: glycosyltransferase family 2 protein [Bacteroidota bacterium]|nr:glycosyltransferase family 2 protein [Bacteroidota bacterium]